MLKHVNCLGFVHKNSFNQLSFRTTAPIYIYIYAFRFKERHKQQSTHCAFTQGQIGQMNIFAVWTGPELPFILIFLLLPLLRSQVPPLRLFTTLLSSLPSFVMFYIVFHIVSQCVLAFWASPIVVLDDELTPRLRVWHAELKKIFHRTKTEASW